MVRDDFRPVGEDAVCRRVEGGAVVFHRRTKRLFALNEFAVSVWTAAQEGKSDNEIRDILVARYAIGENQAALWLADCLAKFGEMSKAEGDAEAAPIDDAPRAVGLLPPHGHTYRLLDCTIRIVAPDGLSTRIDSLLGDVKIAPGDPVRQPGYLFEIAETGRFYRLTGPSSTVENLDADSLIGELEQAIVQTVVPQLPHLLSFHAAMVGRNGRGLLLVAPSGSGKTTLTAALAAQGWGFLSDELTLLTRDLSWRGLPLPPCIKAEGFESVAGWWPGLDSAMEHKRFSRRVKYLRIPPGQEPARVGNVVFPTYRPLANARLEPLPSLEGLTTLLAQCVYVPSGFDSAELDRLLAWHSEAKYWSLVFSDCRQAAAYFDSLVPGESVIGQ